jgi:hypothetical protein
MPQASYEHMKGRLRMSDDFGRLDGRLRRIEGWPKS